MMVGSPSPLGDKVCKEGIFSMNDKNPEFSSLKNNKLNNQAQVSGNNALLNGNKSEKNINPQNQKDEVHDCLPLKTHPYRLHQDSSKKNGINEYTITDTKI